MADCVNLFKTEVQTEVLLAVTSLFMAISVVSVFFSEIIHSISAFIHGTRRGPKIIHNSVDLFLSSAFAISLPLMSYLFSQAKQHDLKGKAHVILTWMVLIESIRVGADPIITWAPKKAAEQFVRLLWVAYLVYSYASDQAPATSACLFIFCAYSALSLVLKKIMLKKADESYLIGKNPKLIHNYVNHLMFQEDLHTTPMCKCDYIVMGEENHSTNLCSNGYLLKVKKPETLGILTIGRVFQLKSHDDKAFTTKNPYWRDICVSLALAKMLRRRFAKLPQDEAGCKKALDFVLAGLIGYIGNNKDKDQPPNGISNGEIRDPERIFTIICEELKLVSEFLHMKVPIYHFFFGYMLVDKIGASIVFAAGIYIIINQKRAAWLCPNDNVSVPMLSDISKVMGLELPYDLTVSALDPAITVFLFVAWLYIQSIGFATCWSKRWINLNFVERYIKNPAKWKKSHNSPETSTPCSKLISPLANCIKKKIAMEQQSNAKKVCVQSSVLDLKAEIIFLCIKVNWCFLMRLPKWFRRKLLRANPTALHSTTDTKEAVLRSLRNNGGRLSNGETSLRNHGMDHLNWACRPDGSTTEAILVWHIATTLFHHKKSPSEQNHDPHQKPSIQENKDYLKERNVALELSSYCHYLVAYFPELLPDEVERILDMYEQVIKGLLDIDRTSGCQKRTEKNRCISLLNKYCGSSMVEEVTNSVVEKGAKLANELKKCTEDRVWKTLAEFWAEMILFVAPSENVEGHEKILHQGALITQLWALLTHAGILTRPKPTEPYHMSESNEITVDVNV